MCDNYHAYFCGQGEGFREVLGERDARDYEDQGYAGRIVNAVRRGTSDISLNRFLGFAG